MKKILHWFFFLALVIVMMGGCEQSGSEKDRAVNLTKSIRKSDSMKIIKFMEALERDSVYVPDSPRTRKVAMPTPRH